jgi:NAD(P)-dependent dehydrogenase (short-subunit alcohol dehydrogenase family)
MAIALITGASRGIGRTAAIELGKLGFHVILAARTQREGEGRDDGDFGDGQRRIEGSLESAAAMVREAGGHADTLQLDLRDRNSIYGLIDTVLKRHGRIDVLINNALDHAGNNVPFLELTAEVMEATMRSNAVGPLLLTRLALPAMIQQGGGRIINVISVTAYTDPPAPVGEGGWGVLYGMAKAAVQRIAGAVVAETGSHGVMCFSLDPGFVKTAVVGQMPFYKDAGGDTSEQVPALVIAWLASSPDAAALNGQTVKTQDFALLRESQ